MHRTNVSDVLAIRANAAEKLQLLSASTSQHYSTIRYLPLAYHSFPNYEVLIAYTIHTCALVSVCVSLSSCASMVENADSHANGQWWRIPEIWISGWHDRRTENLAYYGAVYVQMGSVGYISRLVNSLIHRQGRCHLPHLCHCRKTCKFRFLLLFRQARSGSQRDEWLADVSYFM